MNVNPDRQKEWEEIGDSITASIKKMAEAEQIIVDTGVELAATMKRLRIFTGLSQAGVAKIMGVTDAYVSQLEIGKRPWTPKSVKRLLDPIIHMTP
jgi:DNA-binding transcriptional regulator YiaG